MNGGTFPGISDGAAGGVITDFMQTPVLLTSQTISVPAGTKRIEALLVGGGGGGGFGGGGFGGAAVYEIPVTGRSLSVVIGAGGTGMAEPTQPTAGGTTSISSAGVVYAEVGGGGAGLYSVPFSEPVNGRNGGGGGGGCGDNGGRGGNPSVGRLLWSAYGTTRPSLLIAFAGNTQTTIASGSDGVMGGGGSGGGGGSFSAFPGGAGGGGGAPASGGQGAAGGMGAGSGGSGSGSGAVAGGSLTSVSVWGITGKAGGSYSGSGDGGSGGGGLLSAGSSNSGNVGGAGGLGGGGGGGGTISGSSRTGGAGGNGAAVIRFYF